MRRTIIIATVSAGLLALGACAPLGQRSTLAQLEERCDRRDGTLRPGGSQAEGGVRCVEASVNTADGSARSGRAAAGAQLSAAVDRSLRGR